MISGPIARRSDRGSVSAFVVIVMLAVVACGGLVVDGGRIVGAKVAAADHAENAARAGAQAITTRDGVPLLEPTAAGQRAYAYLAAHGVSGSVGATPERITVTVTVGVEMTLLTLVGVHHKTVSATRSSAPIAP